MTKVKAPAAALFAIAAVGISVVSPSALAGGETPPPPTSTAKCNAGNGNGSELVLSGRNCTMGDPGRSYAAGNRGGDEYSTYGGVANPGGNNVP